MRRARRSRQTEMVLNTHGGRRSGAGRKRTLPGPKRVSHRARPKVKRHHPVHVTTRIRKDVPRLRNRKMCAEIRKAMLRVLDEAGFRMCEFSVQGDHLHLVCEADDNGCLSKGIKRFKQIVARAINRRLGREGSVFFDRYEMTVMTSPRQVRNTLCYVLHNARRHGAYVPAFAGGVDPYSSAYWFDGWQETGWREQCNPPPDGKRCVARAESWLLTTGWKKHGLIEIDEVPAACRA